MPQKKIKLSDHELNLLKELEDIIIKENGDLLFVQVKSSETMTTHKKRRNLRTRKTKKNSPSIRAAYSKLGI